MRGRLIRRIAVALVVLIGLFFAADAVALQFVQSRGATQLVQGMAAEKVDLDLGGLPFLPSFLRGRLRRVEVHVTGATGGGGLRVHSFQARVHDVEFDASDAFALVRSRFGGRTPVKGNQPYGRMEIAEQDLEEYVRRTVTAVKRVQITASGITAEFSESGLGLPSPSPTPRRRRPDDEPPEEPEIPTARFLPRLEKGRISLRLVGVAGLPKEIADLARTIEGPLELPPVPGALSTDVNLGRGVLVLEAQGNSIESKLGQGGPG